jgi:SAM-dependent methyltransferase
MREDHHGYYKEGFLMSFSADWLDLRESTDHASRNLEVLKAVQQHFTQDELFITDIGCGTGSNLRGLAPLLRAKTQHWTLVDYDEKLLLAAEKRLSTWLKTQDKAIKITYLQADLNKDLDKVLARKTDLLTAAAFFDLTSEVWINHFVKALAPHSIPFYTILTYDGFEAWSPAHPQDKAVLDAFHADQKTDKGFGIAAGPEANNVLMNAFKAHDYSLKTGKSPWVISDNKPFMQALARGSAGAVSHVIKSDEWLEAHLKAEQVTIGHDDLFAHHAL